ncbi:MAG: DUF4405 domain-containing protein [Mogibacterium sp.]|nr:DUF4405 domain-containing protein [Mogibacterium sp.]
MKTARTIIDILMILALPLLMAYSLIGEKNHELLGVCMFALFAAHHIVNRRWWRALFKGRYSPVRAFSAAVDVLLAIYMVTQPVSGLLMSKHILVDVTLGASAADLRSVHMGFAYWGFVLLSVHMGLHTASIVAKLTKAVSQRTAKAFSVLFAIISAYGAFAFIRRGIADYLLFRVQFAYFDPSASRVLFLLDYVAVMVLVATITNLLHKAGKKQLRGGKQI